jgi:hopanoid biosynthesis associated RND transporter like protein HpnN
MRSLSEGVIAFLVRIVSAHPLLVAAGSFALAFLSLAFTRDHLAFWTERNVLLSQKNPFVKHYQAYRREFPDDYLILVVTSNDLDRAKQFASELGERLQADPVPVQEVFYRIPMEQFRRQALLYLDAEEIDTLRERISAHRRLLEQLAATPDLTTLLGTINHQISRTLVSKAVSGLFGDEGEESPEGKESGVDPEDLKLLSAVMESLEGWLTGTSGYRSPWNLFLGAHGGLSEDGFLVDEDRGWVFMLAYLREVTTSFNREGAAIERIRDHIHAVSERIPGVTVGITGTPALNSEEMAVSLRDMTRASVLALALVTTLFVVGFGHWKRPLIAVLALGVGIVWTLGWLSLTVGHLTILSMAFGSILIGLGIDFGIHVVVRYETERGEARDSPQALQNTLHRVGRALFSSAFTTVAAFFALGLSSFRGLREFGWIAGWGILFCLLTEFVLLPALLLLLDRRRKGKRETGSEERKESPLLERVLGWPSHHPRWSLAVAGGLTLASSFAFSRASFDYNLLHLQARGTEAVDWERKLIEAQGNSSIFAVDMVDSLDEAREKSRRYEALSSVREVESLGKYLPPDLEHRMEEVRRLAPLLEGVVPSKGTPSDPDPRRVEQWISRILFKLREKETGASAEVPLHASIPPPDTVSGARYRTGEVLRVLQAAKAGELPVSLRGYQERLADDFLEKIEILKASSADPLPVTLDRLPRLIQKRLLGRSGKWLLQIYPREDVWQMSPQQRFVEQLRRVNPDVTGPAVVNYESTRSLLDAYVQGGIYSICAILAILLLDFRSPVLAFLAALPLLLGALWTLLGMEFLKISFNPANLVIIPVLVGIGVDNGIHVVRHFLSASAPEEEIAGSSMGRAITLSSLTTIAGFGSLMIAHHQGIRSIGALLSLAMIVCLAASLIALPSLLRALPLGVRRRLWEMGRRKEKATVAQGERKNESNGCI